MNSSSILLASDKISTIRDKAVPYWLSLWDRQTGGFRFAPHQPATLMATAYSVLGLEFTGGLSQLSDAQTQAIISFLMTRVQPDGSFSDPLFRQEDIVTQNHDLTYFQEETTTMCQQALDALLAPPPPPRNWVKGWDTVEGLISYFESFPWKNPWLDSNRVMFALSQLSHDAERHKKPELLNLVDVGLDWIDAHQSPETGLWQGSHEVSLTNAMAATFHFTFYYGYRRRPLQYVERIIDSCLKLQEVHGLFSSDEIGHTCLDYDAIDLLAKASLTTDYRAEEVDRAMQRAYTALLGLYNSNDGGFAHCKQRVHDPRKGRKAKLLRKLGLSKLIPFFIPNPTYISAKGTYAVCWSLLSCDIAQSNAFSTWFRLLGLHLASQNQWLNSKLGQTFSFRRLPFLGYHDPLAVRASLDVVAD
jgi:prenyltransferase beta subunit